MTEAVAHWARTAKIHTCILAPRRTPVSGAPNPCPRASSTLNRHQAAPWEAVTPTGS